MHAYGGICSNACPKKCVCEHAKSVQCFRVQGVPSGIARDVRRLNLGYNHIKDLKSRDFSGLASLEEVILPSCGLEMVEAGAFRAQGNLKILELQKNKLRHFPRGLPHSLETLKLANNRIQSLQEPAFEGLRRLRVLDLQNNLITNLRASTLSPLVKLECLYLDGNNIETVQGSLRLTRLNLLSMGNNRIPSLSSAFFTLLQSLATLRLPGNVLVRVPHDLPQALSSLNLDRNQIRALRSRELGHLRHLVALSVSHNKLVSVDGSLRLPNLTVLEVSGNHLRTLPSRLTSRLERLDCGQNSIQEVTFQQLSGMRQLRHLFLENNTIHHFEANALRNCMHLTNLALEQNLLAAIPEGLPETLVRLDLKGNRIETIQERELMTLKRLQVLNLRNNKLSSLSLSALELLPRLRKVYLDGNPWNCSCEIVRVKRRLQARKVEIRSELCNDPIRAPGDDWRAYLREQDKCEEYIRETVPQSQEKNTAHIEHTDNEEYYDYDA
ncbi:nephrocan-like [Megalops cyprinoides]|uniref:nephrocan-like n=1 Tax=Megalops cyprinoides TaxID=118141 RepID=UPI001864F030|nr:nephrocan-like [Megalops cyprinoides]